LAYGIALEYVQMRYFEGRTAEWLDAVANSLGAIFGIIIFKIIYGNTRLVTS
jgi:VanZ family protein